MVGAWWVPSGCLGGRKPQTPLAHLYGQAWVTGAYEHYGTAYHDIQSESERRSFEAYRVLAQKGITALDGLQVREVPFFIAVDARAEHFRVQREVPERLTYTADMDEEARQEAKAAWENAREYLHTDYAEIARLNWALSVLLSQLQKTRAAIEHARDEQFRITRQVGELKEGKLPFELPYQVSAADYEKVLVLLVERLEADRNRLAQIESAIVSVGLVTRATDSRSASLAANLRKVLVAVVHDSEAAELRAIEFPNGEDQAQKLRRGRELMAQIVASADYQKWLQRERDAALEQIGAILSILDSVTGLPVSKVYKQALVIFRGDADYLDYLKMAAALSPSPELASVLEQGIELTGKVRKAVRVGRKIIDDDDKLATAYHALVNVGSKQAKAQLDKQLAMFQDRVELSGITEKLNQTSLMNEALPHIPIVR